MDKKGQKRKDRAEVAREKVLRRRKAIQAQHSEERKTIIETRKKRSAENKEFQVTVKRSAEQKQLQRNLQILKALEAEHLREEEERAKANEGHQRRRVSATADVEFSPNPY